MWAKRFENLNVSIDQIQNLHDDLKTAYGENFLEVFDYIPPDSPTSSPDSYVEFRFESEPEYLTEAENLMEQYNVIDD